MYSIEDEFRSYQKDPRIVLEVNVHHP